MEQRKLKEQISQYAKKLADKPESRKELTGPLLGIATGMVDKYVQQTLQRPKYISIELKKVQRLSIKPQNIADFVKMTMLLRPSVHYFAPAHNKIRHITSAYSDLVTQEMMKALNSIPRPLAKSGVNSFFSFQENPQMEATSRLAAIFSHRCRNLKSGIKAERGAESSDKSWFSVARKNYRYHGFDLDMLYELQNIASDNGW